MIDRSNTAPRVRATARTTQGSSEPARSPARSWIGDRAPRLRAADHQRHRREQIWAWLSVLTLVICWDAASRMDHPVSPPRVRIAHAVDHDESVGAQNALMPVNARPTVSW